MFTRHDAAAIAYAGLPRMASGLPLDPFASRLANHQLEIDEAGEEDAAMEKYFESMSLWDIFSEGGVRENEVFYAITEMDSADLMRMIEKGNVEGARKALASIMKVKALFEKARDTAWEKEKKRRRDESALDRAA